MISAPPSLPFPLPVSGSSAYSLSQSHRKSGSIIVTEASAPSIAICPLCLPKGRLVVSQTLEETAGSTTGKTMH